MTSNYLAHREGTPTDRPSPLQNRVDPFGEIAAVKDRGTLMGNRGCLHGAGRELGITRWRSKMWICCLLSWYEVRRDVMPPGRWTALFFLDEATALSAGHRPCGYCRRADHVDFGAAWARATGLDRAPRAAEMDVALHAQRVDRRRHKLSWRARPADLPDGVMVRYRDCAGLWLSGQVRPWSFTGYADGRCLPGDKPIEVLTPRAVVAAIEHGYRPMLHPSAGAHQLRTTPESLG